MTKNSESVCCAVVVSTKYLKVFEVWPEQVGLTQVFRYESDNYPLEYMDARKTLFCEDYETFLNTSINKIVSKNRLKNREIAILGPKTLRDKIKGLLSSNAKTHILLEDSMHSSVEDMASSIKQRLSSQDLSPGSAI